MAVIVLRVVAVAVVVTVVFGIVELELKLGNQLHRRKTKDKNKRACEPRVEEKKVRMKPSRSRITMLTFGIKQLCYNQVVVTSGVEATDNGARGCGCGSDGSPLSEYHSYTKTTTTIKQRSYM